MAIRYVGRLRRVFSPTLFGQCRRSYSKHVDYAIKPITEVEFLDAWNAVYPQKTWMQKNRIGLAVSGGVDSMALAALLANAARKYDGFPEPYAFIVDHKLRKESSEEARWVAEQLAEKLGMKSQILSLQWPEDSALLKNFEGTARTKRYQALGLACRDQGITSLVVGHHGDDQAETIFLRLMMGRWRSGLRGIESIRDIPECSGLHGVWKSSVEVNNHYNASFPIESGGIKLLRPLLQFEKHRLLATCKEVSMPWVEDTSNLDKTLTARNAVRYIMRNHTLPKALSKPRLLSLSARIRERLEIHEEAAERLFNSCKLKLDIQTGSLIVRLPQMSALLDRPIVTQSDSNFAHNTATILLSRLLYLVNPKEHKFSISNVANTANLIYPLTPKRNEDTNNQKSFTSQWVWIRQWEGPSLFDGEKSPGEFEYLFSRNPFQSSVDEPVRIEIPPNSLGSDFHCFDGRFWIRVTNKSDCTLVLRPGNEADFMQITLLAAKGDDKPTFRNIRRIVKLIRPADIRYTIPALFYIKGDGDNKKQEEFLGFPSLNESPLNKALGDKVSWEVRYKEVDLGKHAGSNGELDDVFSDTLSTSAHFHGESSAKKFYNPEFVKNSSAGKQLRRAHHKPQGKRNIESASTHRGKEGRDNATPERQQVQSQAPNNHQTPTPTPNLSNLSSLEQLEALSSTHHGSRGSTPRSNNQRPDPLLTPLESLNDFGTLAELEDEVRHRSGGKARRESMRQRRAPPVKARKDREAPQTTGVKAWEKPGYSPLGGRLG
jgi:tRNA(Ile)-lysidine synthetase-like protein